MKTFDDIWEEIHKETEWGKYPSEEIIRFTARNFYKLDRKNTKILDVGCGSGAILWYLSREGFKAYGFDGSKSAVFKAQKRLEEENLKAEVIISDAGNLPYEAEFFDAVIDSAVIYANTIEGIKKILNECNRVLKKGGKFFSSGLFKVGMSGYNTGEKLEENTFRELTEGPLCHRGTVHFFTKEEIEKIWSEFGFQNLKIDYSERSDGGGKDIVSYYFIECEKK